MELIFGGLINSNFNSFLVGITFVRLVLNGVGASLYLPSYSTCTSSIVVQPIVAAVYILAAAGVLHVIVRDNGSTEVDTKDATVSMCTYNNIQKKGVTKKKMIHDSRKEKIKIRVSICSV